LRYTENIFALTQWRGRLTVRIVSPHRKAQPELDGHEHAIGGGGTRRKIICSLLRTAATAAKHYHYFDYIVNLDATRCVWWHSRGTWLLDHLSNFKTSSTSIETICLKTKSSNYLTVRRIIIFLLIKYFYIFINFLSLIFFFFLNLRYEKSVKY